MKRLRNHTVLCREVARHLQDQLDAGLRSRELREIRRHLTKCGNCTAYLDSLKKTLLLYKRYPHPQIASMTKEKLFAILRIREG